MAHSSSHYYEVPYGSSLSHDEHTPFNSCTSTVSTSSVPKFLEYDPTPYGGGYDLGATYGNPIPPSDQTCYRHEVVGSGQKTGQKEDENENGRGYNNTFAWDSSGFGYCPCACHAHSRGGYCRGQSQPSWCANYIFGCSVNPYGQGREFGGNYPNPIFGYERHYQGQSLQRQVQYEEPSLLSISTNFF